MFRRELTSILNTLAVLERDFPPNPRIGFESDNWDINQIFLILLTLLPLADFNSAFRLVHKPIFRLGPQKKDHDTYAKMSYFQKFLGNLYGKLCSWCGFPGGLLYSSLLLVYFGLMGYPGEGPRTHNIPQPVAKRARMDPNFYQLEESKLDDYLENLERKQLELKEQVGGVDIEIEEASDEDYIGMEEEEAEDDQLDDRNLRH